MPNYFTDALVSPSIPLADMTALERLYLSQAFEETLDPSDGTVAYNGPESGVRCIGMVARSKLVVALDQSRAQGCALVPIFEDVLAQAPDGETIEFWLDNLSARYEDVLQAIVRRSPTVKRIIVYHAFTCDRPDPEGFGGAVDLIEPDRIDGWSTDRQVAQWRESAAA